MPSARGRTDGFVSPIDPASWSLYPGSKTYIIDDLVLVRLRGIMTPAEQRLVQAENTARGRELIKQVRHKLLERGRPLLEALIQNILGRKAVSLHTDLSTITGERVMIFTLDAAPHL